MRNFVESDALPFSLWPDAMLRLNASSTPGRPTVCGLISISGFGTGRCVRILVHNQNRRAVFALVRERLLEFPARRTPIGSHGLSPWNVRSDRREMVQDLLFGLVQLEPAQVVRDDVAHRHLNAGCEILLGHA